MSSVLLSQRGPETAPAVFPDSWRSDDDSLVTYRGRAVSSGTGREKQVVNREWNRRIARLGGRDVYDRSIWKLTWGYNETRRDGMDLRYPHVASHYLLLRLMPAWTWGSRWAWYSPRIDEGQWAPSCAEMWGEEYPQYGAYEIDFTFPLGVRPLMPFIEDRIRQFNNRPKLTATAYRRREDMAEIEAQEYEAWKQDYEACREANRAFCGEPMRGYGPKSAAPTTKAEPMSPAMYRKAKAYHRARVERVRKQTGVNL